MYFFLATVCFVVYMLYFSKSSQERRRKQALIDQLPGPKSYPVIGSVLETAFIPRHKRLEMTRKMCETYGPLHRLWIGPFPVVTVVKSDDAEVIFSSSKNIDKAVFYNYFKSWLGTGLLTSRGQKWHERRKMLTPAFHFSILETFMESFVENSHLMMHRLEELLESEGFDIFPYISDCALDIICESAMGVKMNIQTGASREYLHSVKEMTQLITDKITSPWLQLKWVYQFSENRKKQKIALQVLHGMSMKMIQLRKREKEKQCTENDDDASLGGRKKKAFLDLLLDIADASNGKFTTQDIREEVDTFMFEGHDTTSAALVWSIYLVGRHPDVQEKLFEELTSVFGLSSHSPTMKDMTELKYLECVIKESLRLFPSVPFIGRKLVQDVKLGGYEIPSNTTILIYLCHMHHQQDNFPNPEKFDPSNFFMENIRKRHSFAYAPFSAGPRNCIGQKFAMLEMKVVLSTFFRTYKVESLQKMEDLIIIPDSILRPGGDGVQVKITRRNEDQKSSDHS